MKYIIGNWKSNSTLSDTAKWIRKFSKKNFRETQKHIHFIICPPFPLIPLFADLVKKNSSISLGSQDISASEPGAYTGEVNNIMLADFVQFSIIGHSERRKYQKETNPLLFKKVKQAKKEKIEPIFCISSQKDPLPKRLKYVAYEPVAAIGSGQNEPAEKVIAFKDKLKLSKNIKYIYGGSVNSGNIREYLCHNQIDGVLVGGASLDPDEFYKIGSNCLN